MDKQSPEVKKKVLPKRPATFLTMDNSNMYGWLMTCFIVCGCMFFLGVMVGRNTAPVQFDVDRIEEKLSSLQDSVLKQKDTEKAENLTTDITNIRHIPNTVDESEQPIVYENILDQLKDKGNPPEIYEQYIPPVFTPKYAKTPPPRQKSEPEKIKKAPAPEPGKQAVKSKPDSRSEPLTVLEPEVRPVIKKVTAPIIKPEPIAAVKSPPVPEPDIPKVADTKPAGQKFAIQVASLKDPAMAKILLNKFKEKGYPAFCQISKVKGATWHRVRIGPYPERALADKDRNRLKAAGVDSLIISMNLNTP